MTPKLFVRETKYLFTLDNLRTYHCDYPYEMASKSATGKFKSLLKTLFKDCVIHIVDGAYCYVSAFVERAGHFVYINCEDLRDSDWERSVLVRTAASATDYRGGTNNYCTIENLKETVDKLLLREHRAF